MSTPECYTSSPVCYPCLPVCHLSTPVCLLVLTCAVTCPHLRVTYPPYLLALPLFTCLTPALTCWLCMCLPVYTWMLPVWHLYSPAGSACVYLFTPVCYPCHTWTHLPALPVFTRPHLYVTCVSRILTCWLCLCFSSCICFWNSRLCLSLSSLEWFKSPSTFSIWKFITPLQNGLHLDYSLSSINSLRDVMSLSSCHYQ